MDVSAFNGTTSVVFGGRGFIGSHLVQRIVALGGLVRTFDRPPPLGESTLSGECDNPSFFWGDFANKTDVFESMKGCDYCFHLISTTLPKASNADPVYDVQTNLVSTLGLLDAAVQEKVRKVVFISSGGTVYGTPTFLPITESHPTEPICSYGITKLAIEKYLHLYKTLHGLEYQVLRLSNPFGEFQRTEASQGAIAVFLAKALREETIEIWGDGGVVRDYIHISDVVEAITRAAVLRPTEAVFNIGSGHGISINELLTAMEKVLGRPIARRYLASRLFDVPKNVLDISLAREHLGWEPTMGFEAGLDRMLRSLRSNA